MNREIKFRAWDSYHKEMITPWCELKENGHFWGEDTTNKPIYVSSSEHVMQYTGLKDKNGKEIFEGDILNAIDCELVGYNQNEWGESEVYADAKGKVHYVGAGFCFDGHSAGDLPLDTFDSDALEVIGNIYENPDLLATSNPPSL